MKPLKRFGQNFLKNKLAIKKIVGALDVSSKETVVEIGPGNGEITGELLKKTDKLIVIEKDSRLISGLSGLSKSADFKIIEGDVRSVLPAVSLKLKNYKLIGNIPYYLTGYLLRILENLDDPPKKAVFIVQREVAERISGKPRMNQLAAIVKCWAEPRIIFSLKPGDFSPPPKVRSSALVLNIIPADKRMADSKGTIDLIKIGFRQPRKTLFNNLSFVFGRERVEKIFADLGLDEKLRAENLPFNSWQEIKNKI